MKDTKRKILDTALRLFNQEGLSNIKLRRIATEMGISQGNLNYHFKKRADIVEALYFQLLELMNQKMAGYVEGKMSLPRIFEHSRKMMMHFYDYRFFMLDFVQIMRLHPSVNEHYKGVRALREQQFIALFQLLAVEGLLRSEEFEGEWQGLNQRSTIIGDFWLSSAVVEEELKIELVDKYAWLLFEAFYPYLTEKGKEEFREMRSNKK